MSREALQESLSAVMDNEADDLELRRVLAASGETDTRAAWSRYQLARAAMHKELLMPKLDIASAVFAAIDKEEAHVAPSAAAVRKPWGGFARIAVAASVTVAVLAGVRLYNQDAVDGAQLADSQAQQPAVAAPQTQVQGPAMLAGYSESSEGNSAVEAEAAWQEKAAPELIREHVENADAGVAGKSAQ